MTTNEIIAMAREADPFGDDGRLVSLAMLTPGALERFAALVAAAEREACAQVCDGFDSGRRLSTDFRAAEMASAIRAMDTPDTEAKK